MESKSRRGRRELNLDLGCDSDFVLARAGRRLHARMPTRRLSRHDSPTSHHLHPSLSLLLTSFSSDLDLFAPDHSDRNSTQSKVSTLAP